MVYTLLDASRGWLTDYISIVTWVLKMLAKIYLIYFITYISLIYANERSVFYTELDSIKKK